MDKSSPVFENFMNKMSAMQGQGRPKINKSTFKIGGGMNLEGRVANNEKKITTLKNIFKAQRVEIGEKITPKVSILEESLIQTNNTLFEVSALLKKDYSERLKEQNRLLKAEQSKKLEDKRDAKENRLETSKKVSGILKTTGNKITKPFTSVLDKILSFGKLFLAGVGVNAALTWLSDPKNLNRFLGILKAITDRPFLSLGTLAGGYFIIKKTIGRAFRAIGSVISLMFQPKKLWRLLTNNKLLTKVLGSKATKSATKTPTKFVLNKIGKKLAQKTGLKALGAIPVIGDVVDLGVAIYRFSQGDIAGGFLSLGSAIPFLGWGFAAIDIAREFGAFKGSLLDKERYDSKKNNSRAGKSGTSVSTGMSYNVNDRADGLLEFFTSDGMTFTPLTPGNIISAREVDRRIGRLPKRNSTEIIELPIQDMTTGKNKNIAQSQAGGSSKAGAAQAFSSQDAGNTYGGDFPRMIDLPRIG